MNPEIKTATNAPMQDAEPTASMATLPLWIFVVMVGLLYWAALTFDSHGGWFDARVYSPYDVPPNDWQPPSAGGGAYELGERVYNKPTCVACHQAHGKGMPGQFPTLHGTDWVIEPEPGRIIRIVLNGLQGPIEVEGSAYNNAMVPWKDVLSDEEIAAVLTYVRQQKEWGNKAPAVTPEQVKAVREKIKDRSQPYTAEELLKVSPAD